MVAGDGVGSLAGMALVSTLDFGLLTPLVGVAPFTSTVV
jgi:hypothetical protein